MNDGFFTLEYIIARYADAGINISLENAEEDQFTANQIAVDVSWIYAAECLKNWIRDAAEEIEADTLEAVAVGNSGA